jgi:hypothetical protein
VRELGRPEHASTEQLSALLDDRGEPEDRAYLAGHVDGCIVCSNELADLRTVRGLLRAMPVYLPPRNFTIPVEMVRVEPRFRRLIPITRVLSALAAVLCVVLFAADAMTLGSHSAAPVPDGGAAYQITASASQPRAADASRSSEAAKPAAPSAAGAAKPAEPARPAEAPRSAFIPAPTSVAGLATIAPAGVATSAPAAAAPAAASAARAFQPTPGPSAPNPPAPDSSAPNPSAPNPAIAAAPAAPAPQPAAAASPAAQAIANQAPQSQAQGQQGPILAAPSGGGAPAQATAQASTRTTLGASGLPTAQATASSLVGTQTSGQPIIAPATPAQVAGGSTGNVSSPAESLQRREPAPPPPSPWLSPIRLTALALAVLSAACLIGSLVLSRMAKATARAGAPPRR